MYQYVVYLLLLSAVLSTFRVVFNKELAVLDGDLYSHKRQTKMNFCNRYLFAVPIMTIKIYNLYYNVSAYFTLQQATKAQRAGDVQLYSFFNLGAGWGGWSTPRTDRLTPGNDPVPTV